jgi:hypothetical protein
MVENFRLSGMALEETARFKLWQILGHYSDMVFPGFLPFSPFIFCFLCLCLCADIISEGTFRERFSSLRSGFLPSIVDIVNLRPAFFNGQSLDSDQMR